MDNSTIVAIATPAGRGGIGIIKISGPEAVAIATAIFRPANSNLRPLVPGSFVSHRLYFGHVTHPQSGEMLDQVLLSVMKAPRSYTREDVVEINAHGGSVALKAILELVIGQGARLSAPGEFTRRAFINGRIDLTQAEAVIDLINARTDRSLLAAASQLRGELKSEVEAIRKWVIQLLTRVEAAIDFPEDVAEIVDAGQIAADVGHNIVGPLQRLLQHYHDARVIREGLNMAVVGRPNVGKSSLMNRLVRKDRAIVTDIPGTTRDVIEETLDIMGIPVIVSDTAGLHDSDDPVETIGIKKTMELVSGCDLVLFMVEADHPLTENDHQIYAKIQSKPLIIVPNKIDLLDTALDNSFLPDNWKSNPIVPVSALYGQGFEHLMEQIVEISCGRNPIDLNSTVIPNLRHKELIERSIQSAEAIASEFAKNTAPELIAIHIQEATDSLGEILGDNAKVDVLESIFSQFCIGK